VVCSPEFKERYQEQLDARDFAFTENQSVHLNTYFNCSASWLWLRFLSSITTGHIMSLGVAYAIWCGTGIVLIAALSWLVYGQKLDIYTAYQV